MTMNAFNLFLGIMSLIALIVFIALYFVKAGYGIFRTASWGVAISNKLAWILMEAPDDDRVGDQFFNDIFGCE